MQTQNWTSETNGWSLRSETGSSESTSAALRVFRVQLVQPCRPVFSQGADILCWQKCCINSWRRGHKCLQRREILEEFLIKSSDDDFILLWITCPQVALRLHKQNISRHMRWTHRRRTGTFPPTTPTPPSHTGYCVYLTDPIVIRGNSRVWRQSFCQCCQLWWRWRLKTPPAALIQRKVRHKNVREFHQS